jgi:hypothetical protein
MLTSLQKKRKTIIFSKTEIQAQNHNTYNLHTV